MSSSQRMHAIHIVTSAVTVLVCTCLRVCVCVCVCVCVHVHTHTECARTRKRGLMGYGWIALALQSHSMHR